MTRKVTPEVSSSRNRQIPGSGSCATDGVGGYAGVGVCLHREQ